MWLGEEIETHWLQRILNSSVAGRKPRGRSRKTWEETITEDRPQSMLQYITHIDPTDRTALEESHQGNKLSNLLQSGKMDFE